MQATRSHVKCPEPKKTPKTCARGVGVGSKARPGHTLHDNGSRTRIHPGERPEHSRYLLPACGAGAQDEILNVSARGDPSRQPREAFVRLCAFPRGFPKACVVQRSGVGRNPPQAPGVQILRTCGHPIKVRHQDPSRQGPDSRGSTSPPTANLDLKVDPGFKPKPEGDEDAPNSRRPEHWPVGAWRQSGYETKRASRSGLDRSAHPQCRSGAE